jgi:hypothetical protein
MRKSHQINSQVGSYLPTLLRRLVVPTALILLIFAAPVMAQEVSASITGVVTDPSGAVVMGASVVARDLDRGTTWPTSTNEQGGYLFPRVPAGRYEVKVEAKGFKSVTRSDLVLEVNQRARLDFSLEVGAITESIQVTGAPPLLQTDTTIVGSTVTSNQLSNTPLISRNFITLTLLAAGVTTTNPAGMNNDQRTGGGGRPYVNGNRKEANNFLLDGIDNNQVSDNLTSYQPNLDAIAEVKMITNNASAEFGNFQGGIINVTMKSGTNEFHGSVFEFFKNDKLNANAWSRNWTLGADGKSLPRSYVRYNSFGGTVGGPIKKDKMFFFADYQGLRRPTPGTIGTLTVAPATFRNGDFSQLLDTSLTTKSAPIILYNPYSLTSAGARTPFPNNQIPASMESPVAKAIYSDTTLYPLPANTAFRQNQYNVSSSKLNNNQGDGKFDWKMTSKDDLSVRYSQGMQEIPGFNTFGLYFNSFNDSPFKAGVINWTRTFSPSLVNEARAGVNRITLFNGGANKEGYGDLNQKYGIAGVGTPGLLSIAFSNGFTSSIGSANIGTQQLFANTTYHYADNLTLIKGRHMMKMGGQILRQQMNTFYAGNNGRTGLMTFTGRFTAVDSSKTTWGDADFFLGLPEVIGRGLQSGTWGHRKTIWGFYFQDDWRITKQLTLNLGLRWEYHTPLVEVKDRQSNFSPFLGTLLLAGQDGNSRALYNPYKKDFQPRVGFAWTPTADGKTVIRGAYTISSFMEGTGTNLRLPMNPPFNAEFEGRWDSPAYNLPGTTASAGLSSLSPKDPYKGTNIRLWDPGVRPANTQQWNFTVERQLPYLMVASVAYVGQAGHHLVVPMPYYQKRLQADGSVLPSNYLCCNPLLAGITQISGTESNGNQKYNAMQASLTKRFSGGLEFQANYTFSKGMSDAIGYYGEGGQSASQSAYWQNLYDRKGEWGPTYFDAKQMLTLSHVWALPVGKGQKWASDINPVLNGFVGGWQIGGILTLRSGFPLTIQGPDNSGTLSRGARASVVAGASGGNTLGNVGLGRKWFNISPYTSATKGTFGNVGIGTERGPGFKTYDVSFQKIFNLTERFKLQLRGEFINLTNTPQFSSPNRSVTAAAFGEVSGAQYERQGQLALRLTF